MPLWIAGAIVGGAVLGGVASGVGDSISAQGAEQTNAQTIAADEQMQQNAFNFDNQSQQAAMNYDTEMSNSAMQRRVQDLQAAGLNPLLAVSQGGASAPTISGQTGPGGSVNLQNPDASYANLGAGVSGGVATSLDAFQAYQSATTAQSQRALIDAQAADTRASAAMKMNELPYSAQSASTQLDIQQAQLSKLNSEADEAGLNYNLANMSFDQRLDYLQKNPGMALKSQDLSNQIDQLNIKRAALGMPSLENDAAFVQTPLGKWIVPLIRSGVTGTVLQGAHGITK